jgi:diguanylate cyclase (GGDEF)-like protein
VSTTGASPLRASAIRAHVRAAEHPDLTPAFAVYLVSAVAAAGALGAAVHFPHATAADWGLFVVLTVGACAVHLISMETSESYSAALVFFVAGALLLPPQLTALMIVLVHLPPWVRGRHPWYTEAFAIARWTCAAFATYLVSGLFVDLGNPDQHIARLALGGTAGAVVFVLVERAMLAGMLALASDRSLRLGEVLSFGSLSTELVLALLGVGIASAWEVMPALVPFLLAPLLVVGRSLQLPSLERAARLDPKTDLYNARYFATAIDAELERAKRFERPLSVVLVDLDLLREVNNTYGHLAGDTVLRGVADLLRTQLRPFDIPCRFGGEEFAVILPEAGNDHALAIAERIRRSVAASRFTDPSGEAVIRATVSLGVATFPDCGSADDLVHRADLALYRSKSLGRNRTSGTARAGEGLVDGKEHLRRMYLETIAELSRSIEGSEVEGGREWVRQLSVALGKSLGFSQAELEAIEVGAALHDVGKLAVPARILNKPGPLTDAEWEVVREHPAESDQILSGVALHPFVRQIVRSSHERIDGAGYPDGLTGEEIPLPARIVLVADALDAIASDRPYRPGRPVSEALVELRAHAGTQFCPTVVAALENLYDAGAVPAPVS